MNLLFRYVFACLIAFACTACGIKPVDPGSSLQTPNDSYFVIGAKQDNIQFIIERGDVVDGKISPDGWSKTSYADYPENGFLVGKVRPGDTLVLSMFFYHSSRGAFLTSQYKPCGDAKVLTFRGLPGKVTYLTDIQFVLSPDLRGFVATYRDDIAGARNFMKDHFPLLADKLELGSYELMKTNFAC